jgi:hypothetical protein
VTILRLHSTKAALRKRVSPISDVIISPIPENPAPRAKADAGLEPIFGAFCEPPGIVLDHSADRAPPVSLPRPWAAGSSASNLT